jgi:hypothetical protein
VIAYRNPQSLAMISNRMRASASDEIQQSHRPLLWSPWRCSAAFSSAVPVPIWQEERAIFMNPALYFSHDRANTGQVGEILVDRHPVGPLKGNLVW